MAPLLEFAFSFKAGRYLHLCNRTHSTSSLSLHAPTREGNKLLDRGVVLQPAAPLYLLPGILSSCSRRITLPHAQVANPSTATHPPVQDTQDPSAVRTLQTVAQQVSVLQLHSSRAGHSCVDLQLCSSQEHACVPSLSAAGQRMARQAMSGELCAC